MDRRNQLDALNDMANSSTSLELKVVQKVCESIEKCYASYTMLLHQQAGVLCSQASSLTLVVPVHCEENFTWSAL